MGQLEEMMALLGGEFWAMGDGVKDDLVKAVVVGNWRVMLSMSSNGFLDNRVGENDRCPLNGLGG